VLKALKGIELEDTERLQAASDALKYEIPPDWENELLRRLAEGDQRLIRVVAEVTGYRRMDAGALLLQALQESDSSSLSTIIWALGHVREVNARASLMNYLQHEDEAICSAAALALLRIGAPEALDGCLRRASSENWPLLPLGLGGGRSTISALLRVASDNASADCLIALGLLGDISVVDTLLAHLEDAELAESAALALNLITGAELYEEAFIPEEIDEDELFDDELEALKRGEYPPPDEEPPGITIERLSQDAEEWREWWTENRSYFRSRVPYRSGKPYSPAGLLENLESEKSPNRVRRLAYEELVIRYDIDFPFEIDMPVVKQKETLAKYTEWIRVNGRRFREGQWYFAGQSTYR
jgi:hypothetical protein